MNPLMDAGVEPAEVVGDHDHLGDGPPAGAQSKEHGERDRQRIGVGDEQHAHRQDEERHRHHGRISHVNALQQRAPARHRERRNARKHARHRHRQALGDALVLEIRHRVDVDGDLRREPHRHAKGQHPQCPRPAHLAKRPGILAERRLSRLLDPRPRRSPRPRQTLRPRQEIARGPRGGGG